MTLEVKKARYIETIEKTSSDSKVGLAAYIPPSVFLTQEAHDQEWQEILKNWQNLDSLEIQYEHDYCKNWWRSIPEILKNNHSRTIIHGPTQNRDIASNDEKFRLHSVEENKRALDLAATLGAEAMILHITPQDDFCSRSTQIYQAIDSFLELSRYIEQNNLPVSIMLENLEYPKWPTNLKETKYLITILKAIHPKLTSCVDLAHLWHNQVALLPAGKRSPQNFPDLLIDYIAEINSLAPIKRFHFAGAYVDKEYNIHQTHGAPNPHLQQTDKMDVMPVRKSLSIMNEFIKFQIENGEKPADIILEMHIALNEQEQALKSIQKQLS